MPLGSRALPQPVTLVYGFRNGKQKATLTLSDGGAESRRPGPAHWTGPPNRRETASGAEFVYREGRHTVREIEQREPPKREVVVMLANGLIVTAAGERRHEDAEGPRRRRAGRRRRSAGPPAEVAAAGASPRMPWHGYRSG